MNLRNVEDYNIGLDIGTASVGWAVTDVNGELCHFKGKPTWGSRLFPEAQKAAEARTHRGQRRRYNRRRWRLNLLQGIFAQEMETADPEFFIRLNQSRLLKEDRAEGHADYRWPLFNDKDFTEKDYYDRFPTIYHLRTWLMSTDEKADIRLIYLAFHNIVKTRGNFLQQDNRTLSSTNANVDQAVDNLCGVLRDWCEEQGLSCAAPENSDAIKDILKNTNANRSALAEQVFPLLAVQPGESAYDAKSVKDLGKAISKAIVGNKAELGNVFFALGERPEGAVTNIYLSNDEQVEAFAQACPDDGVVLFEAMQAVFSSFVLQEILRFVPGASLSVNKVAEYDDYGSDLKALKTLAKEYAPDRYDAFFRGPLYERLYPGQKPAYDLSKAQGYTLYDASHKTSYDDFKKSVEKLFKGTGAETDPRYAEIMEDFGQERFLRRLKTSDNGSIPYQLHLEEMRAIIDNQRRHYPFLEEEREKLESLVSFRIPYYVGPLTDKNARKSNDSPDGKLRFTWSKRLPGKENERIYPWNWEQIIDKDESATRFITRMTGTCTYIQGEPVLPKCSLLYQEFCVLNELNGAHFTHDGDSTRRFDSADRQGIFNDLFKRGGVTYRKLEDWMLQNGASAPIHVSGGQGERGFESKLSTYLFFKKDVLGVDEIPDSYYPMLEDIVLWNTIFEDRDILQRKIKEEYGNVFSDEQIKKICRKRFTGWGKLSKRLLEGVKAETDAGLRSIMDVLRDGDPTNGHHSKAMVLMEALRDDKLQFQKLVDDINAKAFGDASNIHLEDLPGSPALRRSINQALGIVDEIIRITKHEPKNIFIEVTRSDDDSRKGQRTKRRYDAIKEGLKQLKADDPEWWNDEVAKNLASINHGELTEKLTLYFMQGGKSLYSGKPLDIHQLHDCQVDHILPQSYIKDDSFENKALVLASENQAKSNQMLLPSEMRRKMRPYWEALHHAGLIGDKKLKNLMRDRVSEKQLKGFINRQIVETSQIVKTVQMMLEGKLKHTNVLPVKAGLSSELRRACGFVKCREINDFHHAHDALLACQIGRFLQIRFPMIYENPLKYQHVMRKHIQQESEAIRQGKRKSMRSYGSPFIISSFLRSGFDMETGEVDEKGDAWNAPYEMSRIAEFLDYRQCYISRMPEETAGAFWDATIYSPHDPKKKDQLKLPLKKGLDPKKYGSYSSEQFAYFFIYKATKKGKPTLEFAPVPLAIASSLSSDSNALSDYAAHLATCNEMEFVEVVVPKIYKYQLLEVDKSRLYITGKVEARNASPIAFNQVETAIAKRIVDSEKQNDVPPVTEAELLLLFDVEKRSLDTYSPRLASVLKLDERQDGFLSASVPEKAQVVLRISEIASANTNKVDLSAIGGGKFSGAIQPNYSKLLNTSSCHIIHQSITGMFEKRVRIGL